MTGLCFVSLRSFAVSSGRPNCIIPFLLLHLTLPLRLLIYSPVCGSGCGAFEISSFTCKVTPLMWSLLDSLSQSKTVTWALYDVSYRWTWKRSFSS